MAREAAARPAIGAPGRQPISYGELDATVTSVHRALAGLGFGRGDRIAVVLPNGPEMAVAFLAITAGFTCAPLNPASREEDFVFYLKDLRARGVILAEGSDLPVRAAARQLKLPVIELSAGLDGPAGRFELVAEPTHTVAAAPALHELPEPDDVALVLHTSGTTARPKIVPLTQRNLCTSARSIGSWLGLGSDDVCLNIMPLFHIHGLIGALLSSLSAGGSVICTPGFRAPHFFEWIEQASPTWYSAVPTMHQAVLAAAAGRRPPMTRRRLRFVRSSSASLPPPVMLDLAALFQVPVVEAYGMTEATHQMASNPVAGGVQKPGSVGVPVGIELAIVNEAGQPIPTGQSGEIVIRGPTVMRGYEANPAANESAFVDGWFRTGDQGYLDADGYLFLTGRLKELINRGGEKIAPREIEEVLLQHSAVAEAVAFAVPHGRLGEDVAAAVVLQSGARVDPSELRELSASKLPYFKVPRLIVIVGEIPKGPTGKLQRNGLAERLGLTQPGIADQARHVAPRTPLERELAQEWERLLNVDRVGVQDDFFALGGDSLAATELILAVWDRLQVEVPIAEFLEQPTIEGLLRLRERARQTPKRDSLIVPIQSEGTGAPVFFIGGHNNSLWPVGRLARHLGKQRRIFGLRTPGVDRTGRPPTIEELAARNLEAIRGLQAEGPYDLIGDCFGGVVAFEMARQLEQQAQRVGVLVMVDCFNTAWTRTAGTRSVVAARAHHGARRVSYHWRNLWRLSTAAQRAYLRERIGYFFKHWSAEAGQWMFDAAVRFGIARPRPLHQVTYANTWARRRYIPQRRPGKVLLVRASAPTSGVYLLPQMGWEGLLEGDVEVIDLPGPRRDRWSEASLVRIAAAIRRELRSAPSGGTTVA